MGPTAVGKTSFAIALAKALNTEIISADARQCYKEMNIGVARPSVEELKLVQHHFIASHSITENINASYFENWAMDKVETLFSTKDAIVMVGGTGLYIKAFCEGLDLIPAIDAEIRENIIANYEKLGMRWLQKEVSVKDPQYWEKGEQKNPQRLMRALEVMLGTGSSITSFQNKKAVERPFKIVKIGLELDREELYQRINDRVLNMVNEGLEKEVESLQTSAHLNALQTVGYQEIFEHLRGEISLQDAVTMIKQHTRQYAKRQMTWFTKDNQINWLELDTKS
jgi:tRNA dimethylallyltransferase